MLVYSYFVNKQWARLQCHIQCGKCLISNKNENKKKSVKEYSPQNIQLSTQRHEFSKTRKCFIAKSTIQIHKFRVNNMICLA